MAADGDTQNNTDFGVGTPHCGVPATWTKRTRHRRVPTSNPHHAMNFRLTNEIGRGRLAAEAFFKKVGQTQHAERLLNVGIRPCLQRKLNIFLMPA